MFGFMLRQVYLQLLNPQHPLKTPRPVWTLDIKEKIFALPGIEPRPRPSHYTDCTALYGLPLLSLYLVKSSLYQKMFRSLVVEPNGPRIDAGSLGQYSDWLAVERQEFL